MGGLTLRRVGRRTRMTIGRSNGDADGPQRPLEDEVRTRSPLQSEMERHRTLAIAVLKEAFACLKFRQRTERSPRPLRYAIGEYYAAVDFFRREPAPFGEDRFVFHLEDLCAAAVTAHRCWSVEAVRDRAQRIIDAERPHVESAEKLIKAPSRDVSNAA